MVETITWVGLDTSKRKHVGVILEPGSQTPREFTIPNEARAIRRLARKLTREAPGEVRVCYEAGPCGYVLQRQLEAGGKGLVCEVVAPSLIPVRPGERIKTDRRDAEKLAKLYRSGELVPVRAPTESEEAVRDLVRCREAAKRDLLRLRNRLSMFLLRRGRVYADGRTWTVRHGQWLSRQVWDHEADGWVFEEYRHAISQVEDRIRTLDVRVQEVSEGERYREPVGWLRCFRGIDTVTALTIVAEIHDFRRFRSPRQLMSYLGLVPSECSTGERRRQGGITKAGNAHVRRVLIESAWSSRHPPHVGAPLRKRREGQPAWVIAIADRGMRRLWHRYRSLRVRGKPENKIVATVARELAGFIWAVLEDGHQRQRQAVQAPSSRCTAA